jgi:hypothetical protein
MADPPPLASLDLSNTEPLQIGFGGQTWFRGAIADVQLHARALSEAEIHRQMA